MSSTHTGPFAQCAHDQKPVPVDGLGTAIFETGPDGHKVFFCSEACRGKWLAEVAKLPPSAGHAPA